MDESLDPENLTVHDRVALGSDLKRTFLGIPLQPFSSRRMMAAQAIGLRAFSMSDEERARVEREKSGYDGAFLDAAKVVWLRAQDPANVTRAALDPAWAVAQVLDWVEKHDIMIGSSASKQMLELFTETLEHVFQSAHAPEGDTLGKPQLATTRGPL